MSGRLMSHDVAVDSRSNGLELKVTTVKAPASAWAAWAVALVCSAALPAVALAPTYAEARSGLRGTIRDTKSLISENGNFVLVLLAVPLAITLLVGLALLLSRLHGALTAAWALTVLLMAFNALALLTIGILVVPTTVALIAACSLWGYPE